MNTMNFDEYNKKVKNWGTYTRTLMLGQIRALNIEGKKTLLKAMKSSEAKANIQKIIKEEGELNKNLSVGFKAIDGEIIKVSFRFPKQGLFAAYGTSKGHPSSNPRTKKNWFENVLKKRVPDLADLATEMRADYEIKSIFTTNKTKENG
jgi:hypothetical protein